MLTKTDLVHTAASSLTRQQIQTAMELASASNFNSAADPAFVGAVLVALAVNTSTLRELAEPKAGK